MAEMIALMFLSITFGLPLLMAALFSPSLFTLMEVKEMIHCLFVLSREQLKDESW